MWPKNINFWGLWRKAHPQIIAKHHFNHSCFLRGWGLRVLTIFKKEKNEIGMRSSVRVQRYVYKYIWYNAMACDEKIFVKKKKRDFLEMTFRRISFKDYCAFVFVLTKTLKDTTKKLKMTW